MAARNSDALPAEAEQLKGQIQDWRQAKANPSVPMPGELWAAAIRLAKDFGVCRISRAVGLDYGWLRKRVAESGGPATRVATKFLELPSKLAVPGAHFQQAQVDPDAGCMLGPGSVIDLSAPDGARMRIRLEAGRDLDAAGLVAAFLGRGR
ncbi:MAG: hypothetical protein ABSH53_25210 [Holophaga sp.]|jgi:hypothetical protein